MADLYDLKIQDASEDVYARTDNPAEIHIKTHYEKLDIAESKQVYYICFALPEKQNPPAGYPIAGISETNWKKLNRYSMPVKKNIIRIPGKKSKSKLNAS